jgi:hypothetical protein
VLVVVAIPQTVMDNTIYQLSVLCLDNNNNNNVIMLNIIKSRKERMDGEREGGEGGEAHTPRRVPARAECM